MRRSLILLPIMAFLMMAQSPSKTDLLKLTDELDAAVQAGDWRQAAQLSRVLKEAVQSARNESMAREGQDLVDSVLSWLPEDTETLVVAAEPFTLSENDQRKVPTALAMAQGYAVGLLGAAEKENLFKAVLGRTVRLAALSARRFGEEAPSQRPPDSPVPLGMIPYQGCGLYAFTQPVGESVLTRPPEETIMGQRTWVSKGSQNDAAETETYFVSFLKPELVLVCNNRDFFSEVISRVVAPSQRRALPASLQEWKQLDRTAPLWGITHYSHNGAIFASLSPNGKDAGAIGLTVEFGLTSGAIRARMISKADPWKQFVDDPQFKGAAHSRQSPDGVWELSVDGKPEAALISVFSLMAALGFIVLV